MVDTQNIFDEDLAIEVRYDDPVSLGVYLPIDISVGVRPTSSRDISSYINQAPFLSEEIPEIIQKQSKNFTYSLPSIVDTNNDEYSVQIFYPQDHSFIEYQEESLAFVFTNAPTGEFNITVQLVDSRKAARNVTLSFEVLESLEFLKEFETELT